MAKALKLHTGAEMPTLGLGTWKSSPGDVRKAVVAAIECGYRHIDCAAVYGNEAEVGAAFKEVFDRGLVKREDLFITSKLWIAKMTPEDCTAAFEKTLADLQLEYLDLYLIHWPFFMRKGASIPPADREDFIGFDAAKYLAVWHELEKLVDAGKTRHIGTSNVSVKKLVDIYDSCRIKPAVNQVEMHPFLAQNDLKNWCDKHHIVITAYSPLGSPDRPSAGADSSDPAPLMDETIKGIATKHGVTPAQVLLRWAVQRGTVAIPKSTHAARLAENINIYHFELSEEDMHTIAALDTGCRLIKADFFLGPAKSEWPALWDPEFRAEA